MISLEDRLVIYNSKNRRFASLSEIVAELDLSAGEKGEKGDVGDKGDTGLQGLQGEKGDQGLQGEQGVQGVEGEKGDMGNGFSIAETYPSIDAMNADFSNPDIAENSFVLITSEDEDNGKLFVKDEIQFLFQSQLSGVKGDKGDRGIQGVQGIAGVQGLKGDKGATGEGVTTSTGSVTISSALSTRGGTLASQNLQKQGIFTKLSLSFFNGNTTTQASGTRLTIGTLPTGFRPTQTVHTFASDNGDSNYPRHAILIESNGNVIWIPQNSTGYFTMNFQVVF